jgi:hypothetical protein
MMAAPFRSTHVVQRVQVSETARCLPSMPRAGLCLVLCVGLIHLAGFYLQASSEPEIVELRHDTCAPNSTCMPNCETSDNRPTGHVRCAVCGSEPMGTSGGTCSSRYRQAPCVGSRSAPAR